MKTLEDHIREEAAKKYPGYEIVDCVIHTTMDKMWAEVVLMKHIDNITINIDLDTDK